MVEADGSETVIGARGLRAPVVAPARGDPGEQVMVVVEAYHLGWDPGGRCFRPWPVEGTGPVVVVGVPRGELTAGWEPGTLAAWPSQASSEAEGLSSLRLVAATGEEAWVAAGRGRFADRYMGGAADLW
jgi:hypothetical protein